MCTGSILSIKASVLMSAVSVLQLGTSPLHFAAQFGHAQTAEVLLRAGISRDARTKVDRTPLHVACQEGHSEIVDLLVRSGADVEAKDMVKRHKTHLLSNCIAVWECAVQSQNFRKSIHEMTCVW